MFPTHRTLPCSFPTEHCHAHSPQNIAMQFCFLWCLWCLVLVLPEVCSANNMQKRRTNSTRRGGPTAQEEEDQQHKKRRTNSTRRGGPTTCRRGGPTTCRRGGPTAQAEQHEGKMIWKSHDAAPVDRVHSGGELHQPLHSPPCPSLTDHPHCRRPLYQPLQ